VFSLVRLAGVEQEIPFNFLVEPESNLYRFPCRAGPETAMFVMLFHHQFTPFFLLIRRMSMMSFCASRARCLVWEFMDINRGFYADFFRVSIIGME